MLLCLPFAFIRLIIGTAFVLFLSVGHKCNGCAELREWVVHTQAELSSTTNSICAPMIRQMCYAEAEANFCPSGRAQRRQGGNQMYYAFVIHVVCLSNKILEIKIIGTEKFN